MNSELKIIIQAADGVERSVHETLNKALFDIQKYYETECGENDPDLNFKTAEEILNRHGLFIKSFGPE